MKRLFKQQSCSSSSWDDYQEENDAIRGAQGVSIWPQRSYSCSFCKREFRSAQALGGHMNVHRRDRALLKQVITTTDDNHDQNLHQTHDNRLISRRPTISTVPQNSPQVCSPKTSVAHLSLLSRVSSNSVVSGVSKEINDVVVRAKMSTGLDLAMGTYRKQEDYYHQDNKECFKYNNSNNKRFKKNGDYNVELFPFFEEIKYSKVKTNCDLRVPEISSLKASKSMEELDLELRLGESLHS